MAGGSYSGNSGGPVPFIQLQNEQFVVVREGADLLRSVTGKVAVLAVAGPYRTGKSYLLNKLANLREGFQVGSTVKACTKGIWIWGAPMQLQDGGPEGNNTSLILLDTEGLSSFEQAQTNDIQIFSLAILLSSMFLLNTQGTINESALEQLELVVECTKNIRYRDSNQDANAAASNLEELSRQFPHFLWVLRDFVLELSDAQGNPISSREYLESALQPQSSGKHVSEKNRIRRALTSVFPRRDCETLVRPVMDERELRRLNELPANKLRPEFNAQLGHLRNKILTSTPLKTVDQMVLNGPALVKLAEIYVDAINKGAVPVIHTAWQNVVTIQSQEAYDAALQTYQHAMNSFQRNDVYEGKDIESQHAVAKSQAIALLRSMAVGDDVTRQQLSDRFEATVDKLAHDFSERNLLMSRDLCRQVLNQVWNSSGADHVEFSNAEQLREIQRTIETAYRAQAKGPAAADVLREFFEDKERQVLNTLFHRVQQQTAQVVQAEESAKQIRAELEAVTKQSYGAAEEIRGLRDALANMERECAALRAAREEDRRALMQTQQESSSSSTRAQMLQEEIARLKETIHSLQVQCQEQASQKEKLQAEVQKLSYQLDSTKGQGNNMEQIAQSLTAEKRQLEDQLMRSNDLCRQKDNELFALRSELQSLQLRFQDADSRRSIGGDFHSKPHPFDWPPPEPSNDAPEPSTPPHVQQQQGEKGTPTIPPNRKDPSKCTINELKSWLTSLGVDIPQQSNLQKQWFIDKLYETEPAFRGYTSPKVTRGKAAK